MCEDVVVYSKLAFQRTQNFGARPGCSYDRLRSHRTRSCQIRLFTYFRTQYFSKISTFLSLGRHVLNPFTATGYFDIPPPRWPTFLVTLFPILKEGMGLSLLDEFEVQYHVIKKVTNSRHMMAPKLRFSRGLKAKAPGAVTACVPGPLRRRSSKFLHGPSTTTSRLAQEATMGKVTIFFFFLPSRVFQVYDCYFTNVLTQRSCLGFLLTADSQCFTRNARTFVPTIPRRRLWPGERSL